jgi:guanylate kinase
VTGRDDPRHGRPPTRRGEIPALFLSRWPLRYNIGMDVAPGKLVVISGPSGVGKTTILRRLLADLPQLLPSVSATTRPPRAGERDGVDYHFMPLGEFESRRKNGEFLECCQVYGRQHWYGTLVSEVAPRLAVGKWVVLEIDVEGTLSILERYPDAITIFVEPDHPDQLLQRLQGRGTESAEAMARRLEVARRELLEAHRYRHRVVNDDVDAALARIKALLVTAGLPPAGGDQRPVHATAQPLVHPPVQTSVPPSVPPSVQDRTTQGARS